MQLARALLANELRTFNDKLRTYLKTDIYLLDKIMHYVVRRKGKQIRPVFVLLSALLNDTPITESTYRAAACVEILHTATLVHDDIVDGADTRRGWFSLNALWKNKISVLTGDYLLSKGLLISLTNKEYVLLEMLSVAVQKMSEAELLQLEKSRLLNIDEANYFKIIDGKTASLIAAACELGVGTQSERGEKHERMRELGTHIGMIFQIKDDLLDLSFNDTGKPRTQDLKEKKLTLPVIYALQASDKITCARMRYAIKFQHKNEATIAWIIEQCKKTGALTKAESVMDMHVKKAQELLDVFPASPAKNAFEEVVRFTAQRTS